MASAMDGPVGAIEAPIPNDSGMVSNLIQVISKHLHPLFSEIRSAIVSPAAQPVKKPLFESFLCLFPPV